MRLHILLSFLALHFIASCASTVPVTLRAARKTDEASCKSEPKLVCVIQGTEGNSVTGTVTFKSIWKTQRDSSYRCVVRIRASIKGLDNGLHGFHIHTYGDIRATDGSSTGGHFANPWGRERPHGLPNRERRHWGDLGNIFSSKRKFAKYRRNVAMITIRGIVGRGMTIHAGPDKGYDYQPSGDSGPRVATCVIGFANPDV